jgi:hypothetical protein
MSFCIIHLKAFTRLGQRQAEGWEYNDTRVVTSLTCNAAAAHWYHFKQNARSQTSQDQTRRRASMDMPS